MKEFWMVWCEGGASPVVQHPNPHRARLEAERLASQNPGKRFCVLQCIGAAQKVDVQWIDANPDYDDELPF